MTDLTEHLSAIASSSSYKTNVVFFDLDRTLIAGFSILAMALETARFGLQQGEVRKPIKLLWNSLQQKSDHQANNYARLAHRLTKSLEGIPESTLIDLGEKAFNNSIAKNLYREAVSIIEAHRAAGHKLVIVSAASHYQVQPIARVLGITDICCTQLEVKNEHFTGQIIAPLCYGEGKVLAAKRVARKYRTSLQHCWFYSDSSEDLPLLKQVAHPVAVNPSEKLATFATAQHWPQLYFESRGLPNMESVARTLLTLQTVLATTALGAVSNRLGIQKHKTARHIKRVLGDIGSVTAGLDYEIEGIKHLKTQGPCVYIFNHQSFLDSIVLAHLLEDDVVAFCKHEMVKAPVIGPLLKQADTIFVDRNDTNQSEVLRQAQEVLNSGRSLVIAPEGTRSTLGDIQHFKHGAIFLAKKAQVPIVPIVLHNVKDALPKGGWSIRPAKIRISVLPKMEARDIKNIRDTCTYLEDQYAHVLGHSELTALPFGISSVA